MNKSFESISQALFFNTDKQPPLSFVVFVSHQSWNRAENAAKAVISFRCLIELKGRGIEESTARTRPGRDTRAVDGNGVTSGAPAPALRIRSSISPRTRSLDIRDRTPRRGNYGSGESFQKEWTLSVRSLDGGGGRKAIMSGIFLHSLLSALGQIDG